MRLNRMAVVLISINFAWLAAFLLQAPGATAQGAPSVIRAQAIELVDERGRVRAQLNVERSGEAVFRMRDASGTIRVKVGASQDGAGVLLLDDDTEPGIHLVATRDGTSLTLKRGAQQQVLTPRMVR